MGAHVVATAGSAAARAAVEGFGAEAALDYARGDLLEAVSSLPPAGYDVILDHRADRYFDLDLEAAAVSGDVVHISGADAEVTALSNAMGKDLTIQPMTMSNLATRPGFPTVASVLEPVLDLVARGALSPTIARTYGLDEAAEVHRAVLDDSYVGKLVVVP